MRIMWPALLAVFAPALALAQLDADTLTITISSDSPLRPDRVQVGITVNAPVTATFDDVLASLQGSGVTPANLTYGSTFFPSPGFDPKTDWLFTLSVPFASLKDTMSTLARLQTASAMDIRFYIQGVQASPELVASNPCVFTTLASQARVQAQKVAEAAGVTVGPIVGISDQSAEEVVAYVAVPTAVVRFGDFSAVGLIGSITAPSPCTMTVQFKLLH
jgi:hypothetical protein